MIISWILFRRQVDILITAGQRHEQLLILRLHQFLQQLALLGVEPILVRHLQMILDCDSDVQDNGIAFILVARDGFHPIRDGVHIPEDLTQDVQFFCRQRGDFIRRGIIRSRPHRIDGQHIPPS